MPLTTAFVPLAIALFVFYGGYFTFYAPYRAIYPDLVPEADRPRSQGSQNVAREIGLGAALVGGGFLLGVWKGLPFTLSAVVLLLVTGAFTWRAALPRPRLRGGRRPQRAAHAARARGARGRCCARTPPSAACSPPTRCGSSPSAPLQDLRRALHHRRAGPLVLARLRGAGRSSRSASSPPPWPPARWPSASGTAACSPVAAAVYAVGLALPIFVHSLLLPRRAVAAGLRGRHRDDAALLAADGAAARRRPRRGRRRLRGQPAGSASCSARSSPASRWRRCGRSSGPRTATRRCSSSPAWRCSSPCRSRGAGGAYDATARPSNTGGSSPSSHVPSSWRLTRPSLGQLPERGGDARAAGADDPAQQLVARGSRAGRGPRGGRCPSAPTGATWRSADGCRRGGAGRRRACGPAAASGPARARSARRSSPGSARSGPRSGRRGARASAARSPGRRRGTARAAR